MIGVPLTDDSRTLRIDTWLMSCRVIARTVEQFSFRTILERARELGYRRIVGEYIPTAKNGLVEGLYETLGFRLVESSGGRSLCFEFEVDEGEDPITFVSRRNGI